MLAVKGYLLYAVTMSVVYGYSPAPGYESIEWIPAANIPYPYYEQLTSEHVPDLGDDFSSDDELALDGLKAVIGADLEKALERYNVHTRARPWMDAVTVCWREGGRLATPGDALEARVLGKLLQYAGINANITNTEMIDAMHVGVHSLNGKHIWRTLEDNEITYSKWISDHPRSTKYSDSRFLQSCAAIMVNGRLVDQFCNQKLIYACEKSVLQTEQEKPIEEDGYVGGVGVNPVKLHESPLGWPAAEDKCEAEGARLAAPRNDREAGRLAGRLVAEGVATEENWQRGIFIGVHNLQPENFWTNIYGEPGPYRSSWAPEEQERNETANCAAITSTGQLISVPCQEPRMFVCEKRLKTNKQNVYKKKGELGHFALYRLHSGWISAVAQCRADNASLALPRSKEEAEALEQIKDEYLKRTQSRLFRKLFVGIQDIDGDGRWHTIDGDSLLTSGFNEWNTRFENGYKNSMLCGGLFQGKFVSVPCNTELISICKKSIS